MGLEISKFAQAIKELNNEELSIVIAGLTREKAYRALKMAMNTPSYSRGVQIVAIQEELDKRNLKLSEGSYSNKTLISGI